MLHENTMFQWQIIESYYWDRIYTKLVVHMNSIHSNWCAKKTAEWGLYCRYVLVQTYLTIIVSKSGLCRFNCTILTRESSVYLLLEWLWRGGGVTPIGGRVYMCLWEFRVRTHNPGNILKIGTHNQGKILKYDPINRAKFSTSVMKRLCFVSFLEDFTKVFCHYI